MSTPLSQSPDVQHEHEETEENSTTPEPALQSSTSSIATITRTVAIIKTHALAHRFDIERRIQESSFEIVKERQMEFDTETDPETLYELFGEDADSLAEGPVWVYVLERRRAVEVWNTLMGNKDTEVAKREAPNSLRALYGLSSQQNGLMGSPDNQTAEIQIASLFVSSPPFPTTELPEDKFGSMRSVGSAMLESIRRDLAAADDEGYAPSSATNPSTAGGGSQGRLNANGKLMFKARALPATHDIPDIVPRTTRSAALRAGQAVEKVDSKPRAPLSKQRLSETFANVPGHKRASTISVASTAAPIIAPRMSRAATLRIGGVLPPPVVRRAVTNEERTKHGPVKTFEGVPGHKRKESIAVASVKTPTVAPRLNKSAALRQKKDAAPPTSFMFKGPTSPSQPVSRPPSRPASQASVINPAVSRYAVPRASSVAAMRPLHIVTASNGHSSEISDPPTPVLNNAVKPRPRLSSIGAPTIAPRMNKSAALRAAKMEAEHAAAAATAVRKAKATKPPSSFKTIPASLLP